MHEALLTPAPTSAIAVRFLDVEIGDAEGVVLDELAARFDDVTRQARENLVGDVGLGDLDAEQRTVGGVERRLPQLLGVHFAQALVALDREALAAGRENRVEQL